MNDFVEQIAYKVIDCESVGGISESDIRMYNPRDYWPKISEAINYLISQKTIKRTANGKLVPYGRLDLSRKIKKSRDKVKNVEDKKHDDFWNKFDKLSEQYDDHVRRTNGK